MSDVAWGTRTIAGVAAAGDATQLFPIGCPAAQMANTIAAYPPAVSGDVRRAIHGHIHIITVASDRVNGGYIELWDVSGLDRGALAAGNVNNGDFLTDAYLTANGKMIDRVNVLGPSNEASGFNWYVEETPFNRGLALRYVGGGSVFVSPFIAGGFSRQTIIGP